MSSPWRNRIVAAWRGPRRARPDLLRRMPLVGLMALVWVAVVDFLSQVRGGSVSLSGLLTVGTALVFLVLAPTVAYRHVTGEYGRWDSTDRPVAMPVALLLFLLVAILRLPGNPSMYGVQNVAVYASFVLGILVTADSATAEDSWLWTRAMPRVALVVSLLFLVTFTVLHVNLYGDRSYALSALVFLGVLVPLRKQGPVMRLGAIFVLVCVVLSLSRTASVIALFACLFLVVRGPRRGRGLRVVGLLLAAVVGLVGLWFGYPPFRERFTSGDAAVQVGGTALNTSGRTEIWAVVWDSSMKAPLFGHGPGTSQMAVSKAFVTITQPHNDYLRMVHDFGFVGAFFWALGLLTLLVLLVCRAHRLDRTVDWAALITLLGLMLGSVTDNVVVYPFVMVPAGVVIGLGLAATGSDATAPDDEAPVGRVFDHLTGGPVLAGESSRIPVESTGVPATPEEKRWK